MLTMRKDNLVKKNICKPIFKNDLIFNCKNENAFYITNTGFYIKKGNPTRKQVLRLNPFYGAIYERLEFICREYYQKVKNRIK